MLPSFVLGGTRISGYVLDMACSLLHSSYHSCPLPHVCFSPTQHTVVLGEYLEGDRRREHKNALSLTPGSVYSCNAHDSPEAQTWKN